MLLASHLVCGNMGQGAPHTPPPFPYAEGFISVQAMSWVIEHSKQKGNCFVVLLMIANHAKPDGTGAWPSISTLAREARITDRTVQRSVIRLCKLGELRVSKAAGPYGSNLYSLPGVKLSPMGVKMSLPGVKLSPMGVKMSELGCQTGGVRGDTTMSPEPSLTVNKDKEELFQIIEDYHKGKTHTDEHGRKYKVSPSTRQRIYLT